MHRRLFAGKSRWSAHLLRLAVVATLALSAVLGSLAAPALAHVDLADSDPVSGARVAGPLESVTLVFTEAARPTGEGVVLFTSEETVVPTSTTQSSDTTIVATPSQPISNGTYAIAWTVQAGDAHPRSGAITFTVMQEPDASTDPGIDANSLDVSAEGIDADPATALDDTAPILFADLVADPNTSVADWIGRIARSLGLLGGLVGVGALVFGAAIGFRSGREARQIGYWLRRSGLAVLVSLPLELASQAALMNGGSLIQGLRIESLWSALSGSFGWAILLRFLGGAGLLWGTQIRSIAAGPTAAGLGRRPPRHPVAAPSGAGVGVVVAREADHRFNLSASPLAVAGAVGILAAFLFDGHTAVASPRLLVVLADLVHVTAGAIWVGGVVMLAITLASRRQRGEPLRAGPMVVRFSSIAAAALIAVGVAGLTLAWSILDSIGELFTTPWGRSLIAKLILVGAAGAIGGYNHYIVLPRLSTSPDDEQASHLLRRTARTESGFLIAALVITAILVGAAS